jgi:hypothetical protein
MRCFRRRGRCKAGFVRSDNESETGVNYRFALGELRWVIRPVSHLPEILSLVNCVRIDFCLQNLPDVQVGDLKVQVRLLLQEDLPVEL